LEHVQIHDTGNGRLHEEEGVVHSFFAEGAKHVHLLDVTNMLQEECGFSLHQILQLTTGGTLPHYQWKTR
jgi:hypothetical protein